MGTKPPSLDGVTMAFLQSNWNIVETDVIRMFSEFFSLRKFVTSLNVTFIDLIPKKVNAKNIRDFPPISLVKYICKLLSKVVARKLILFQRTRMPLLEGAKFRDKVFLANELIDSRIKLRKVGIFVSWISRRLMIMQTGTSSFM